MQINYSNFKQGDVLIVDVRFSNQDGSKIRPVLVISSNELSELGEDIITLKITSQLSARPFNVIITNADLVMGELRSESAIKADFPFVITKDRVIKRIGAVNPKVISKIKEKLKLVFGI